eukprot:RCo021303
MVRQSSIEHLVVEVLRDFLAEQHATQRKVRGGQPLGTGDDIWDDAPVVHREPLARSPQPGHDLVADHNDAILITEFPNALQVSIWGNDDPIGARDGLQEHTGNVLRSFELQHLLHLVQALLRESLVSVLSLAEQLATVLVRVHDSHHPRHSRFCWPPPRVTREGDRSKGGPVVGAVPDDDFIAPRIESRQFDGVLVGLRPSQGEEHPRQPRRGVPHQLSHQLGSRLGRHGGSGVGEGVRLRLDRGNHLGMAMTNIAAHQLRVHVQVTLAIRVPKVHPLGPFHGNGVDCLLRRPRPQAVLLAEVNHFLCAHLRAEAAATRQADAHPTPSNRSGQSQGYSKRHTVTARSQEMRHTAECFRKN